MIKDHGHLGLPPSTSHELLEKHFGEEFSNAQIERRDISIVYYKYGYKAATDCQDLLNRFLAAKKNDPRWVVVPETEQGTNRLTHLFSSRRLKIRRQEHLVLLSLVSSFLSFLSSASRTSTFGSGNSCCSCGTLTFFQRFV